MNVALIVGAIVVVIAVVGVILWESTTSNTSGSRDCQIECSTVSSCSARCGGTQIVHCSVTDSPQGGGAPCPPLVRTVSCGAPECSAVNCVPGEPTEENWSACPSCSPRGSPAGESPKQYQIVPPKQQALFGGKPCSFDQIFRVRDCGGETGAALPECPPNANCVVSTTSSYTSPCSEPCGPGVQFVVKQVQSPASGDGAPCYWSDMVKQQSCNLGPCTSPQACDPSKINWPEEWSECSVACGSGWQFQVREKSGTDDTCPIVRSRTCNLGACSGPAGCIPPTPGELVRRCIDVCIGAAPSTDGSWQIGDETFCGVSDAAREQTCGPVAGACPSPVDCKVGDWSEWGACSLPQCDHNEPGGGVRARSRQIIQHA